MMSSGIVCICVVKSSLILLLGASGKKYSYYRQTVPKYPTVFSLHICQDPTMFRHLFHYPSLLFHFPSLDVESLQIQELLPPEPYPSSLVSTWVSSSSPPSVRLMTGLSQSFHQSPSTVVCRHNHTIYLYDYGSVPLHNKIRMGYSICYQDLCWMSY
jgi:hypothetical protein